MQEEKITRTRYGIVKNGEEILCGSEWSLRFIPFGKVNHRNRVCLYESEAKARSVVQASEHLGRLIDRKKDRIRVRAFTETIEMIGGTNAVN